MKNISNQEIIIIQKALEHLENNTGILASWNDTGPEELDGIITFEYNGFKYTAYVEAKKEVRNHQLPQLLRLKDQYYPLLVIADYIFPKIKEELRSEGIGYLETNGNVFFSQDNILLWLDGQKRILSDKAKSGRAFAKTGIKLVFNFLREETLINLTYREIANKTGIGFGNINFIMTDLKNQGFILKADKDTYKLTRKKELLNKWMEAYGIKLKPSLLIGKFRFLKNEDFFNWRSLPLKDKETRWGGEPAGDLLTNYLKPAELTLYTTEKRSELISHYRLVPDNNGNVIIYQKFWLDNDGYNDNFVPPLLIYVDLVNTGDRRCLETAKKIYDDCLQNKF